MKINIEQQKKPTSMINQLESEKGNQKRKKPNLLGAMHSRQGKKPKNKSR